MHACVHTQPHPPLIGSVLRRSLANVLGQQMCGLPKYFHKESLGPPNIVNAGALTNRVVAYV